MRGGGYYQAARGEDRLAKLTWASVKRLIALASGHKGALALAGILSLLGSGLTLANTAVIKFGVDRVQRSPSVGELDRAMLEVAAITVLSALAAFCNQVLLASTGSRILKEFRERLFAHLQRLPVSYFDKTRSGDISSHLSNDVTLIQATLTSDIANVAGWLATFLGGVAMLFWLDWKLTLVVVGLLVSMMLFFVLFGRMLRKLTRQMLDALSDVIGSMTEALANIRLVKAFAREPWEDERSSTRLAKVLELSIKSAKWESLMGVIAFSGFTLLTMGVLWYGGRNVIAGALTLGTLVSFVFTVMFISGPMGNLASLYTRLQRSVGAAERLFTILDTESESSDDADAVDFPMDNTAVVFSKVEFSYVPENPVLTGLNLTIPNGKVTALVGQSGGGKTTLSALLYRFYEPQNGSISINEIPIRKIKRLSLREHIGVVPQEAILFNGTVMENIRYGRLNATDDEVKEAAKAANVHEFVTDFAQGYDTVVGERGITLSGGQRQRVAIARALLKDPKILILDEATSSLDTRSESLVREALERLMQGRTTLVIAHRLSTIQSAFQIAVLDDGRIMELGTHEELMRKGGRYAELQTAAQFDR